MYGEQSNPMVIEALEPEVYETLDFMKAHGRDLDALAVGVIRMLWPQVTPSEAKDLYGNWLVDRKDD